jgi:hypothetical protein
MTSAIGNTTSAPYTPPAPVATQIAASVGKDGDGDNDGTKAGAADKPKATSGSVGTIVNTSA